MTHGVTGALAGATAVGSWCARRWAAVAAQAWGGVTAVMLVALGPVLDTPPAERPQLWVIATFIAGMSGAAAWYLRRQQAERK